MAKINIRKRYTVLEVGVGKRRINRIFEKFGIVANPFGSLGGKRYEVKFKRLFKIIRCDDDDAHPLLEVIYVRAFSNKRKTKLFIENGVRPLIIEGLIRVGNIKIIKIRKTPEKLPSFRA